MAGMILLVLVIDTCMTVSLAYRLGDMQRRIRKLAFPKRGHETEELEQEDDEF